MDWQLDLKTLVGDALPMVKRECTVILGAGLAGLAAAGRLKKNARILEKTSAIGGLCDTNVEGGFRFDRTGHLLHLGHPRSRRLIEKALDDEPLKLERKSRIFSHGVYTHYPFQANTFGLPRDVVAECLVGFMRARERDKRSSGEPRTFADFIHRHFGEGIARHFMVPYNTKLWGVSPEEITADWCRRFVPIPTPEEVVAGAVGLVQEQMGYNANFLYPKFGIGELPAALSRQVGGIELGSSPKQIDFKGRRLYLRGEWVSYNALISTIPLDVLVGLLGNPPPKIRNAAKRLKCSSLRYVDVALRRLAGTEYHWTYVPERKYPFYRVGCYSNFSPQMAPRGKSNLYVELAGRGPIKLDTLGPKIASGLTDMGIIDKADDIEFMRPRFLKHAYVVYDMNYEKNVPAILAWLEEHGIFSAGRYARWEYSSMEDAILQGMAAAEKVKEYV